MAGASEQVPLQMEEGSTPADDAKSGVEADGLWMKAYSWVLFLEGQAFLGIFLLAYGVQWGLAWHDAGGPFFSGKWHLSPYWDMIIIIYTSLGAYLTAASYDPAAFKPLLGHLLWGANFAHGCIAFAHTFDDRNPNLYGPLKNTNFDKLCFAVPLWFVLFLVNLFFCRKCFGSYLLPCSGADLRVGPEKDHPSMKCFRWLLLLQGQAFLGLFVVAYLVQWGVAWHDAGGPFKPGSINFNPYWDMIIIMYTVLGAFLTTASFSPSQFKPLLGYTLWGMNFCHGCVAFIHCFFAIDPSTATMYGGDAPYNPYGWLSGTNYDKLFIAVPLWFTLFAINIYFCHTIFGSVLLPWQVRAAVRGE